MIVPDVNVLISAYTAESQTHAEAKAWWERTMAGPTPVGLAWITILSFIRISTHRRIFERPLFPHEAIQAVKSWLAAPKVQILVAGELHAAILFELIEHAGVAGDLTTDAHVPALAIEYQAELASLDTDFARFPKLRWFNPITAS